MPKYFIILFFASIAFTGLWASQTSSGGPYSYSDLPRLKELAKSKYEDERISKRAELFFHEILNDYRAKLGKSQLAWLDMHWIAAINHNLWMSTNDRLSHSQKANTPYFSGSSPSDRIRYVNDQNERVSYSGENCLYNWVNFFSGTEDERAMKLAKMLFHQWKSSPGHYTNMTNDYHKGHAIAIYIESSGKVWATSLFGSISNRKSSNSEIRANERVRFEAKGFEKNSLIIRNKETNAFDKSVRLSSGMIKRELLKEFALDDNLQSKKERNYMTKAALKHANYLSTYRTTGEEQRKEKRLYYGKTLQKRLNKASFYWATITGKASKAKEVSITVPFFTSILSIDTIKEELLNHLNNQLDDDVSYSSYGYGIKVRKRNGAYHVTVVKIIC
jgi:uncharacterized protein YkwD